MTPDSAKVQRILNDQVLLKTLKEGVKNGSPSLEAVLSEVTNADDKDRLRAALTS